MKRLLTRTNNPFKISSKFRKQPGSLLIITLNSKDKEEALEHQGSHHRMNWVPGECGWSRATIKTLGLQGCCVVYIFELLCFYSPQSACNRKSQLGRE